jgi:hypothetical protein
VHPTSLWCLLTGQTKNCFLSLFPVPNSGWADRPATIYCSFQITSSTRFFLDWAANRPAVQKSRPGGRCDTLKRLESVTGHKVDLSPMQLLPHDPKQTTTDLNKPCYSSFSNSLFLFRPWSNRDGLGFVIDKEIHNRHFNSLDTD